VRNLCGCVLAALALTASAVEAQGEHSLCWRGKPLPECRTFILTELGVYRRLDPDPTHAQDGPLSVSLDVGAAHNVSERVAVGLTGYLATGDSHARVGARLRLRRWLARRVALDVSPGLIVYGSEDGGYGYRAPGVIAGASLNAGDLVALGLEAEYSRYEPQFFYAPGLLNQPIHDLSWRAGGRLGSALGVVGSLVVVGLGLYLVTALAD